MLCPICNSRLRTTDTVPGDGNTVYRRRKCESCNAKFKTVETMDDGSNAFKYGFCQAENKRNSNRKSGEIK
jgi:transcriptional regulator NrdR family protein